MNAIKHAICNTLSCETMNFALLAMEKSRTTTSREAMLATGFSHQTPTGLQLPVAPQAAPWARHGTSPLRVVPLQQKESVKQPTHA